MRRASCAASATIRSAIPRSVSPTCTSHGLAIAWNVPSQAEPRRERTTPAVGSGAAEVSAPSEVVAELGNQRVQIGVELEARETAHGGARRGVPSLRVVLDARRPFAAARSPLTVLHAEGEAVELAEPVIGRCVRG